MASYETLGTEKASFQAHEGAFKGQMGEGKAKSAPLGQFAKGLNQLIMTPNYL
ncbi:hypothetical protein GCM10025884_23710 [Leuconostoc gelidum subsp. gelidum]|nr:hypothetical protein GCM10025884_23710 [Leuconostoc gelidum subsp. gelidum]